MRFAMDAVVLIADSDVRRRDELRRFFFDNGFLVAAVGDGLECVTELVALEPDVLVMEAAIPRGGGDGVMAQLNNSLPIGKKPLVFVMGDAPAKTLSVRTGVAPGNCFPKPLQKEALLDRIGLEFAVRLLRGVEHGRRPSERFAERTLSAGGVR